MHRFAISLCEKTRRYMDTRPHAISLSLCLPPGHVAICKGYEHLALLSGILFVTCFIRYFQSFSIANVIYRERGTLQSDGKRFCKFNLQAPKALLSLLPSLSLCLFRSVSFPGTLLPSFSSHSFPAEAFLSLAKRMHVHWTSVRAQQ